MISAQAQNYLADNLSIVVEPVPSADYVATLRREVFTGCEAAVAAIRTELEPRLTDIKIGGVSCLEITPRQLCKAATDTILLYFDRIEHFWEIDTETWIGRLITDTHHNVPIAPHATPPR
jgi:hypothetical protein